MGLSVGNNPVGASDGVGSKMESNNEVVVRGIRRGPGAGEQSEQEEDLRQVGAGSEDG